MNTLERFEEQEQTFKKINSWSEETREFLKDVPLEEIKKLADECWNDPDELILETAVKKELIDCIYDHTAAPCPIHYDAATGSNR